LVLFGLLDLGVSLYLFGVFLLLGGPTVGVVSWLIAEGSNGANTEAALKAAGGVPGGVYGLVLGGFVGGHIAGQLGSIIGAGSCFLLGQYLGVVSGSSLARKLVLDFPRE